MISRKSKRKLERLVNNGASLEKKDITNLSDYTLQLLSLGNKLTRAMVSVNNNINIFTSGKDKYSAFFNDIKNVEGARHIYLCKKWRAATLTGFCR